MANRPLSLVDYIGQERIKTQLAITLGACKKNETQLPHMLLYGPPGLGKTTLAEIIAKEFGSKIHLAMGGNLTTQEQIQALLAGLTDNGNDILFIDEIHRMPVKLEEMLYTAMEDFQVEMDIGHGMQRYWIPKFTLIGATTLPADLSRPLRDRFGQHFQLQNYQVDEVGMILSKLAGREEVKVTREAINEIAMRAKGVARIAINLYYRCREFADYLGDGSISEEVASKQFAVMGIDEIGLDENDYRLLNFLASQSRPIGIAALASGSDIDKTTIETMMEPYLVQKGLVNRARSGREITQKGLEWISAIPPQDEPQTPTRAQTARREGMERLR